MNTPLILIGEETLLIQCAEIALEQGCQISAMVSRNPLVRHWAENRRLRCDAPGAGLAAAWADVPCDWLLSISNLSILADDVLALPRCGAVNFHDGPLPRHAGLNAPVWALLEGETQHGICWHLIEGGVDEGDTLLHTAFDILPEDTGFTLNAKAFAAAIDSFPALLQQLVTGQLQRQPQDLSRRSYHGRNKRPKGYGVLDFTRPGAELKRLVRALDHGGYWNPLCVPKIWLDGRAIAVQSLDLVPGYGEPGTVLQTGESVTIACADGAVALGGLRALDGGPFSFETGQTLRPTDTDAIDRAVAAVAADDALWRKRLARGTPLRLPRSGGAGEMTFRPLAVPQDKALAALAALALQDAGPAAQLAFAHETMPASGMTAPWVPLIASGETPDAAAKALRAQMDTQSAFLSDLPLRDRSLPQQQPDLGLSDQPVPGCAVTLSLQSPGLFVDTARIDSAEAERLAARLEALAQADLSLPLDQLPSMTETERQDVLYRWNATEHDHDRSLTMHRAFEAQVARTPEATALIYEDQRLSYAALNARANQVAHRLVQRGVTPGAIVALCTARTPDMVVGALAILKAGGAYLPMDPSYPEQRLAHMLDDSAAQLVLTHAAALDRLPPKRPQVVSLDDDVSDLPPDNLPQTAAPEDLAYLIYTSGSTGTPKGVMVEHRNVLNFYAGMDGIIPTPGTWLAVTSLSFDISVLELFWTTARGFTVVLTGDDHRALVSNGPLPRGAGLDFSLYYWGNDDGAGRDKYALLLEGAQFADQNGFAAVWTPERHFHAFGGPYPNPSVTGAAVASVTQTIAVRGGSVVAPLHHPARIAEEWAVIDNLTNGRAGIALASGWQPDDFVLRPENTPPANKPALMRDLDTIRKLWRGEAVGFERGDGTQHEVRTQPRPVSAELPVWITTAGNPQTWQEAGRAGCHVLTHLLGQSIDEVGDKIKLYHAALREAGHDPKDFAVSLMLHTYIAESREAARAIARAPMKDYLRSAAALIKQYAWAFPAFKRPEGAKNAFDLQLDGLAEDELEAILDFAFERYFNESGLFGTVEDALARAEALRRIGVTEIACLIDFGIDRKTVLDGLRPLAQVVKMSGGEAALAPDDYSIAAQILRHGVTHLQCTPSMARMFALNDEARQALRGVRHLFLGGEPLPGALVRDLSQATEASITNMYGPTETTIWSSTQPATQDTIAPIGLPLANQQLYVLDAARQPVPMGSEGQLWIGGEGVTRGYWQRPDLTAERFADNPFAPGRIYATGDLVRRLPDGAIGFIGRADHQVKLRGHRIELGEIEAALEALPGITQAVVSARRDSAGDTRLIGYYTGAVKPAAWLKEHLAASLPAIMLPSEFVHLEAFTLTPNKKIDRNALPAPQETRMPSQPTAAPLGDGAQVLTALRDIWSDVLGVTPAPSDNFFDLGGHSLLAVQAHRDMRDRLGARDLTITDIFRFPVLSDLADRIAGLTGNAPESAPVPDRAQSRTEAMARRRAMRARRRA